LSRLDDRVRDTTFDPMTRPNKLSRYKLEDIPTQSNMVPRGGYSNIFRMNTIVTRRDSQFRDSQFRDAVTPNFRYEK